MMKKLYKRGFTLVELMIVVAIIGVLAALAIYGVRRYLANAKTAEARNTVGAISRGAVAAYERESSVSELTLAGGQSSASVHMLCTDTAGPVPSNKATDVANKKYTPTSTDYATTAWRCLKFELTEPQYYAYQYTSGALGMNTGECLLAPPSDGWVSEAQGDLNGDTIISAFCLTGGIQTGSNNPVTATQVEEVRPDE